MKNKLPVWLNHTILALLTLVLLFTITFIFLNVITDHHNSKAVPHLIARSVTEINGFDSHFIYKILDSIYDPLQKPGTIIAQEPEPGAYIKSGRTVYLHSIRYTPPLIVMPALLYKSQRQALAIIQSYGFKTGWIKTSIADCNGCVIAQMIGSNTVNAGDSVLKGSTINLMIGMDSTAVFVQDSISLDSINALSEPQPNDAF